MKAYGTQYKSVLASAPMWKGKAEQMIGTAKRAVTRLITDGTIAWDESLYKVVYGHLKRSGSSGTAPFELIFGRCQEWYQSNPVFSAVPKVKLLVLQKPFL